MCRRTSAVCSSFVLVLFFGISSIWAGEQPVKVQVHWDRVIRVSQTTPTLLVGASPALMRGAPLHDQMLQRLKDLGADDVRYAGAGYVYPHLGVAELEPPTATRTSWDFSLIDPVTEDVMKALQGHPVALNFTTIPAWMFKTAEPVRYPADPRKEAWHYGQGTELRDPTYREVADYFARLVAWHVKGGFTDELGKWHPSGHHYKVDYWEVFNEPDLEHGFSAETYTKLYDAVVEAIHKVSPQTKFVGISHSYLVGHPEYLTYFLNPKHHKPGIPLDMISYHFYAVPNADEPPEAQQFTYFNQADKFLEIVGYIETIRKMLSPKTGTMVNEIGTMLPDDWSQTSPDYVFKPIRPSYWSLSAATYAYVFAGLARLGIDAAGESGIPCGPGLWASIAMLDWDTGSTQPAILGPEVNPRQLPARRQDCGGFQRLGVRDGAGVCESQWRTKAPAGKQARSRIRDQPARGRGSEDRNDRPDDRLEPASLKLDCGINLQAGRIRSCRRDAREVTQA